MSQFVVNPSIPKEEFQKLKTEIHFNSDLGSPQSNAGQSFNGETSSRNFVQQRIARQHHINRIKPSKPFRTINRNDCLIRKLENLKRNLEKLVEQLNLLGM